MYEMGGSRPDGLKLYNFADNHDVERIYTKLNNKAHFTPVHILMYTLPGVPSVYYGSEFGIEGKKERFSDDSLRPALELSNYEDAVTKNAYTRLIAALGKVRQTTPALSYGDYQELLLTNRQYAYSRNYNGQSVITAVNNDDSDYVMTLRAGNAAEYVGVLSGEKVSVNGGNIVVNIRANSGDIWLPVTSDHDMSVTPVVPVHNEPIAPAAPKTPAAPATPSAPVVPEPQPVPSAAEPADTNDSAPKEAAPQTVQNTAPAACAHSQDFEDGKIAGLQEAILAIMEKNGPVTDQMRKDVEANVYHDSLITWIKSFR
uniref:Alpha-amylase C-terminal domain-containing protein n=1 Tax=Eubacterium plexicaudatum ASF492 TaxID=1235802 RepID=N2A500_9FIRM